MAFDFARFVVPDDHDGDGECQPFGLVHGHHLNGIVTSTSHDGPRMTLSVPRSQKPPQPPFFCACDFTGKFHQGLRVSVEPTGDPQHFAGVPDPRNQGSMGPFCDIQIWTNPSHHLRCCESTAGFFVFSEGPCHGQVQFLRLVDAVRFEGGHALKPRGGMPFFIGVHHPAGQRNDRQSRRVSSHVQAVFGLGCDALIEHVLGEQGALFVGSNQHRHVCPCKSATFGRLVVTQATDQGVTQKLFSHVFVCVVNGFDAHLTFKCLSGILAMVLVDVLKASRQSRLHGVKKAVVPVHNLVSTPPIVLENLVVQGLVERGRGVGKRAFVVVNDIRQMKQLTVIPVPPTVNGLFAVANHKGSVALGKDMVDQRNEVLPLRDRGVLEFVDEHVPVPAAQPLKQKRHGVVPHHPRHPVVQRMKGPHVAHLLNGLYFLRNQGQCAHQVHFVKQTLAQHMGLTSGRARDHVGDLFQDIFGMRTNPLDRIHRAWGCGFGGEYPFVKHLLQCGGRCKGFSSFVLFEPSQQRTARHVFFGQPFLGHLIKGHLHTRLQFPLFGFDILADALGNRPKILWTHVSESLEGVAHAFLQHLFAIRVQGVPNAAVLLLLNLQPGKPFQQLGEFLLPLSANPVQHVANSLIHQAILVQFDAIVLIQGQIPSEAFHQPVREAVQRHDREFPVTMKHRGSKSAGALLEGGGVQTGLV